MRNPNIDGNGNTFAQLAQNLSTTLGSLLKVQPNKLACKTVVGATTAISMLNQ